MRDGWLTRQHGGWPMAIVPVLAGSSLGGITWPQLLLAVSWLIAFLWFDALTLWMKATIRVDRNGKRHFTFRRGRRYVPALITYGAVAAAGASGLVLISPRVLFWGLGILPWFFVSWFEMWRGKYQSFWARTSAIIASGMLAPIAYDLGSRPDNWAGLWVSAAFITTYFIGTVPYVKTLIRERGNRTWIAFSIGYHAAMTAATALACIFGYVSWWLLAAWVVLTIRAWVYPEVAKRRGKPLRPQVVGISEFIFTAVVLAAVLGNYYA